MDQHLVITLIFKLLTFAIKAQIRGQIQDIVLSPNISTNLNNQEITQLENITFKYMNMKFIK